MNNQLWPSAHSFLSGRLYRCIVPSSVVPGHLKPQGGAATANTDAII